MKHFILTLISLTVLALITSAQDTPAKDTVEAGGMVIIKDTLISDYKIDTAVKKKSRMDISWGVFDIGFSNFKDNTVYSPSNSMAPGLSKESLNLRTGKSINVNIWLVMSRLNLVNNVLNVKYGLGVELNNYRFEENRLKLSKTPAVFSIDPAATNVKKVKFAADYVTVPLMLNFKFNPKNPKRDYGFSAGISGGYLFGSRYKTKTNDDKDKVRGRYNLNSTKVSYIGELNLGKFSIYGSYATKSMWESGLDQTPFTVGLRFGKK